MKTLRWMILAMCFVNLNTFAQSKYENGMKKALEQFKSSKTSDELINVSAFFERIADAEKTQWLPYYYAALTNTMCAMNDAKIDKDKFAERSLSLVAKAEALDSNNAELFCLRNMIATSQMMVDPMTRWQSYGAQASTALANAKKADPSNPRPYYLEAQGILNTPEAFGGGKVKAKPLFEKAVDLYKTFTPKSDFHPNWGKEEADQLLKACQ